MVEIIGQNLKDRIIDSIIGPEYNLVYCFIERYKSLVDFSVNFDSPIFCELEKNNLNVKINYKYNRYLYDSISNSISLFVGVNGSGKSNLLEFILYVVSNLTVKNFRPEYPFLVVLGSRNTDKYIVINALSRKVTCSTENEISEIFVLRLENNHFKFNTSSLYYTSDNSMRRNNLSFFNMNSINLSNNYYAEKTFKKLSTHFQDLTSPIPLNFSDYLNSELALELIPFIVDEYHNSIFAPFVYNLS